MGNPPRPSLYVVCFTGDSGITHYSISLARELSAYARVTLVTGKNYQHQGYPEAPFTVLPFFRRSRWYPFDLLHLLALMLRDRPDTVLFQSVLKMAIVEAFFVRAIRLFGIHAAMTIHDVLPHYPKPWSRKSHAFLYRSFDKLIVHSERSRADIRALGVNKPVLVVPHGVYDIFMTHPPDRTSSRHRLTPFVDDDFVILFFGKIDARKGLARFLDLREALSSAPGYRFVIAGRNGLRPDEAALSSRLEEARRSANCIVHDHNIPFDEVQEYFALADLVVLPYEEGSTSGVLKLALAFGKPVVATDVGDIGETLRADFGVLVPPASTVTNFVEAVHKVRARFDDYVAACLAARECYGWARIGAEYARFLAREVIETSALSEERE